MPLCVPLLMTGAGLLFTGAGVGAGVDAELEAGLEEDQPCETQ